MRRRCHVKASRNEIVNESVTASEAFLRSRGSPDGSMRDSAARIRVPAQEYLAEIRRNGLRKTAPARTH